MSVQKAWSELLYPREWPLAHHEASFLLPHLIKDGRGVVYSFDKARLRELDKQFDASLMRSYRDRLSDAEIDDLVSYLMTLTGPNSRMIS